jgi:hypothetical protein
MENTFVYDNAGRKIAKASKQWLGGDKPSGINAVPITKLAGIGKCVFGFRVRPEGASGWIPLSAFGHAADDIERALRDVKEHYEEKRPDDHDNDITLYKVKNDASAKGPFGVHYVYPYQRCVENKAKYYFQNGFGVVNQLMNVPRPGEYFGSAIDVLSGGAAFYRIKRIPSVEVPIFVKDASKPLMKDKKKHHAIRFVYGFSVNNSGQHRYGWMNSATLAVDADSVDLHEKEDKDF